MVTRKQPKRMPPEADWMLMASLHDEEDVVADPIIIDPTDEGAPVSEYMEWYRKTGFYTSVTHRDIKSKEDVMAINKTPTNHIILRIWTKLFKPEALDFGRHAIALEDSIIIDSDRIKFRFGLGPNLVNSMKVTSTHFWVIAMVQLLLSSKINNSNSYLLNF